MIPTGICPITKLTAVTAMSIMFIGSRIWVSAITRTDGGFSPVILFGPYRAGREAASAMDNPAEVLIPAFAAGSATAQAYGGCVALSQGGSLSSLLLLTTRSR